MFEALETKRLRLKNIGYDDADFFYREFSTEAVNAFLYDAEPLCSVEEAREWIGFYLQEGACDRHRWIIVLKDTGERIGTCGFHCWNRETGTVEMGYDLQPAYWRQGYITEAIGEIIRYAKQKMNVRSIAAHIAEGNIASIKTVMRLGFYRTDETYLQRFHGQEHLHFIYRLDL